MGFPRELLRERVVAVAGPIVARAGTGRGRTPERAERANRKKAERGGGELWGGVAARSASLPPARRVFVRRSGGMRPHLPLGVAPPHVEQSGGLLRRPTARALQVCAAHVRACEHMRARAQCGVDGPG
eukprot:362179-Chlamydomonas_euryale.AAC.3